MNTLVQTLETNVQAARDRLRNHQERFEKLSREMKVSLFCESAGFMTKSPLDNTSESFTTWMMILEE